MKSRVLPQRNFSFEVDAPFDAVFRKLHQLGDGKTKNGRRWLAVQNSGGRCAKYDVVLENELWRIHSLVVGFNITAINENCTYVSGNVWTNTASFTFLLISSLISLSLFAQNMGTDNQWVFVFLLLSSTLNYPYILIRRERNIKYIQAFLTGEYD